MKKLFTLIIALGSMTALFAQQGPRQWPNEQGASRHYSAVQSGSSDETHGGRYSNENSRSYNSGYASPSNNNHSRENFGTFSNPYERGNYGARNQDEHSYRGRVAEFRRGEHFRERRYFRGDRNF